MGHTKRNYEEMQMDELLTYFFNHNQEDDDYQYELWRERQEQAEQDAYEQHLADRHSYEY